MLQDRGKRSSPRRKKTAPARGPQGLPGPRVAKTPPSLGPKTSTGIRTSYQHSTPTQRKATLAQGRAQTQRAEQHPRAAGTDAVRAARIVADIHARKVAEKKGQTAGESGFTGMSSRETKRNAEHLLSHPQDFRDAMREAAAAGNRAAQKIGHAYVSPGVETGKRADKALATALNTSGASSNEIIKAMERLRNSDKSIVSKGLEQLTRPASASAGYFHAGMHGKSPIKGAIEGFKKNDQSFSQVLKDAGAPKWLQSAGGLTLDVALDPTTYVTLGTGVPAETAAKTAERIALAAGKSESEAFALSKRVFDAKTTAAKQAVHTEVHDVARAAPNVKDAEKVAQSISRDAGRTKRGLKVGLRGTPVRAVSAAKQAAKGDVRQAMREAASARRTAASEPVHVAEGVGGGRLRGGARAAARPLRHVAAHSGKAVDRATGGARGAVSELVGRSTREVMSAGRGRAKMTEAVDRALGKAGAKRIPLSSVVPQRVKDTVDEALSHMVYSYRRRDIHPLEHERIRTAAREYRAGRGRGERVAVGRVTEYQRFAKKHNIDEDGIRRVAHAMDAGDIARLKGPEHELASMLQRDMEDVFHAEVQAGVRQPHERTGARKSPTIPAVLADPKATKTALGAAKRDRKAAERDVQRAVEDMGAARGRAETQSRDASGRAAENTATSAANRLKRAAQATPKTGSPRDVLRYIDAMENPGHIVAGGHGVRQSAEELSARVLRAREALTKEKAAEKAHAAEKTAHGEQTAANSAALKDLAAHMTEAKGYWPRNLTRHAEADLKHGRGGFKRPGSATAKGTSENARRDRRSLDAMPAEHEERYVTGDLTPIASRILDAGHGLSRSALLNRLAPLGTDVKSLDDVNWDHVAAQLKQGNVPLAVRDEKGIHKPLFRSIDREDQAAAKLDAALKSGKDVVYLPQHLWDEAMGQASRGRGPQDKQILGNAYDRIQGLIKTGQTVPNPGYHITNLIGDTFNARLGGATAADMKAALRLVTVRNEGEMLNKDILKGLTIDPADAHFKRGGTREYYKGLGGQASDAEVVILAQRTGAIQMGFAGQELTGLRQNSRRGIGFLDSVRAGNEMREDVTRLASFRRGLKSGMSPEDAARHVNAHHFDYGDLTETERRALRRFIPFYTFMARNVPLQAKALMTRPGIFANVQKVRDWSAEEAGLPPDWTQKLQEYNQRALPFAMPTWLPGSKVSGMPVALAPKLPMTDLTLLDPRQWDDEFLQRLSPIAKIPLERLLRYNSFFREPVTGKNVMVPAPSWVTTETGKPIMEKIAAMVLLGKRLPGGNDPIRMDTDPRTGKKVPYWDWRMDQAARTLPMLGALMSATTPGRTRYSGSQAVGISNYLTGPRRLVLDPAAMELSQLGDQLRQVEDRISYFPRGDRKSGEATSGKEKKLNQEKGDILAKMAALQAGQGSYKYSNVDPKTGRKKKKNRKSSGLAGGGMGGSGMGSGGLGGGGLGG